ncbi:hypothetical protein AB3R30_14825 [Leptolyngbyaceae cyanobacterium UHCC 1019]
MTLRSLIALSLVATALISCGSSEKKPLTVGEVKGFATVCDKANDGKRVAVKGYLRLPEKVNPKTGAILRLYPTTEFNGKPVGVSTEIGSQPNQIGPIPEMYRDKDLKVNIANGQVAGFGTKVKVSGDLYYPMIRQEFPCALSNPLVELAK